MSTKNTLQLLVVGVAVAGCAAGQDEELTPMLPMASDILMGNLTCAEAARWLEADLGDFELRVEPGAPATYPLDEVNRVTFASEDQRYLDWSSTIGVDAVLVQGGGGTLAHRYEPEARGGDRLTAPVSEKTGEPFAITGVVFCYDHELVVSAAAMTSLTRTHAWTIDTVGARSKLGLPRGLSRSVAYRTTVARAGWTDHDWSVHGGVAISNPSPYPAQVVSVAGRLAELRVKVVCPTKLPFELAPFSTMVCRYERPLPDAATRFGHMVVDTGSYEVRPGGAVVVADLAEARIEQEDTRVEVIDDRGGRLGTASADHTFTYDLTIGPSLILPSSPCGRTVPFTNTVTAVGGDSGATARDSWTVDVTVLCK